MTDEVVVEAMGRQAPLVGKWKEGATRDYVADVIDCWSAGVDVAVSVVVGKGLRYWAEAANVH